MRSNSIATSPEPPDRPVFVLDHNFPRPILLDAVERWVLELDEAPGSRRQRPLVNRKSEDADEVSVDPKAPLARCNDCPLKDRPIVMGCGPDRTDRVIVGEAPGETEVREGKPFEGKAGRRLDKALIANRLRRSSIYITNAVLCHPERNQSPPPLDAIKACHDRLIAEIDERSPRKVLALGKVAGKALTGDSRPIEQLRLIRPPSPYMRGDSMVRVTYHPSSLRWDPGRPERFDFDVGWL